MVLNSIRRVQRVLLTGHSLGGALATIGSIEILGKAQVLGVLTFEAPPCFNQAMADYYQSILGGRTLRITNACDPIPTVGFEFGLTHCGKELHINEDGTVSICAYSETKVCQDFTKHLCDMTNCRCSGGDCCVKPWKHCETRPYLGFNLCGCTDAEAAYYINNIKGISYTGATLSAVAAIALLLIALYYLYRSLNRG